MMIVPIAFWFVLLATCAVSWRAGDRGDRRIIVAIVATAAITSVARLFLPFLDQEMIVLAANLCLLAIVLRHAMLSSRHWSMWFAGIQAAACLMMAVALALPPGGERAVIAFAAAFWSIPALLAMAVGLARDRTEAV